MDGSTTRGPDHTCDDIKDDHKPDDQGVCLFYLPLSLQNMFFIIWILQNMLFIIWQPWNGTSGSNTKPAGAENPARAGKLPVRYAAHYTGVCARRYRQLQACLNIRAAQTAISTQRWFTKPHRQGLSHSQGGCRGHRSSIYIWESHRRHHRPTATYQVYDRQRQSPYHWGWYI